MKDKNQVSWLTVNIVLFQKIPMAILQKIFRFECNRSPLNLPIYTLFFPLKTLPFELPSPSLRISNELPWGGHGYFMEPNITTKLQCSNNKYY